MYKSLLVMIYCRKNDVKKGCVIFILCLVSVLKLNAQNAIKLYTKNETSPINNIDPASDKFDDVEIIGKAIGNSRIVMLGEQDHGDAFTFEAKSRLIRYLHEKMGFNVLAFECDFQTLNTGWDKLNKSEPEIDTFLRKTVTGLWSYCDACSTLLYHYIPNSFKTQKPLQVTGMDCIMRLRNPGSFIDSLVKPLNLPVTQTNEYTQFIELADHWYNTLSDTIKNNQYLKFLNSIKVSLIEKGQQDNFGTKVIENLIAENIHSRYYKKEYSKSMNARDYQMAQNIKWLASVKYPNEKIIIWAHNYHVSKYGGHYPENFLNAEISMGTFFTNEDEVLQNSTYIIGFTSFEGTTGRLYPRKVYSLDKPKPNSFETWIDEKYTYSFTDFRPFNKSNSLAETTQEPFYMCGATKGNYYHKSTLAQWNKVFDGVFFIRTMRPCENIAEKINASE